MPIRLPAIATSRPSPARSRVICPGRNPRAKSSPTCFGALFDPQAEQEHDEHHRRGNHEEAEAQEEHAEGRRAGRGRKGLVLDRTEDESLRHGVEIEPLGKRLGRGLRGGPNPQRGRLPKTARPQPPSRGQRDEGLGRGAVLGPVFVVVRLDPSPLDLERQVPIFNRIFVGQAANGRREVLIGGHPFQFHDRRELKIDRSLLEKTERALRLEERDANRVAQAGLQPLCRPGVQGNLIVTQLGHGRTVAGKEGTKRRLVLEIDRRDGRIGYSSLPRAIVLAR